MSVPFRRLHRRHSQCRRCIYKDGAVFPRPGLAEVPHVQHMGTMDVSWAFTSPPSGMAMVGQPGGGPIKHLSGLGAVGGFARAFEPRSSTGAVRGSLSGVGPLWWGAPPGGGGGVRPRPPTSGGQVLPYVLFLSLRATWYGVFPFFAY